MQSAIVGPIYNVPPPAPQANMPGRLRRHNRSYKDIIVECSRLSRDDIEMFPELKAQNPKPYTLNVPKIFKLPQ